MFIPRYSNILLYETNLGMNSIHKLLQRGASAARALNPLALARSAPAALWRSAARSLLFASDNIVAISVLLAALLVLLYAYLYVRFPFWCRQPVLHTYDLLYKYAHSTPFVAYNRPLKTKFCDFANVKTVLYQDAQERLKTRAVDLLQCYYIRSDKVFYSIDLPLFDAHFKGHEEPAYLSVYTRPEPPAAGGARECADPPPPDILGVIASRPVRLLYLGDGNAEEYTLANAYLMDFLCVHRNETRNYLGRNLIQTHEYNQRAMNPDIQISLLRAETEGFGGVVPLVEFNIHTFYLRNLKLPKLRSGMTVSHIHQENTDLLSDFLHTLYYSAQPLFSVCVVPSMGALISMCRDKCMHILCFRRNGEVLGYYFFKDACVIYESAEGGTLQLVASFCNTASPKLFYRGFLYSVRETLKIKRNAKMLLFDEIGHNSLLLPFWMNEHHAVFKNAAYFYLYNFIFPKSPVLAKKCFIVA
jgi:hypothetical protein